MLQKNDGDLVDTINSLPDSILGLILSFLPTKEAVLTSLLSKRWKLVWVTVHNLDFSYAGCWKQHNEDKNMNFVRFVNHVLLLNDVELLNKFSLVWHPWCISFHCSSWINTAIARNVRHLSLSGQFDLPESVFSCDSLQSLELKGRICVRDVFVVCLPRLESLELDGVDFQSEEAFEKLVKGCSMLNNLCLDIYSNDDDGFTYTISSTSLRRFELCFKHKCSLKLKACSLEYIEVFGCVSETFAQENMSSLVGAYFSIHLLKDEYEFIQDNFCNSIVEAVGAFDHGKSLNLSADGLPPITRFHPDRVFNMLRRQSLRPDNMRMFVLHEAVLSREFEDQIYDIFQLLPPKIEVGLFSATMAAPEPSCEIITRDLMMNKKPAAVGMVVNKKGYELTLEGISQCYVNVQEDDENHKLETLYNLVESMSFIRSVIFVNTRRKVDWLTDKMRSRGDGRWFRTSYYAIHGDMEKNARNIMMCTFCRGGASRVFITSSSNLFAEEGGINVQKFVNLVINYDLPSQPEEYLHRSGRFGRNNGGSAISLITTTRDEQRRMLLEIQQFYNIELKKLAA